MNDLPGYKLMDEDFGSILPSITADNFFYKLWIEGREKVVENEIGQWIYFDGWLPGTWTQPGLSNSGSGNMDQSWEPIKEQVKLGSLVQTQESINEDNLEENEESQLPVKEITELSCTLNTVKMNNICPVTFRIWNQEPKEPDPGKEEKKFQLHINIMTIYKSVLNKFKSVKQQTSQNPHSPLIKAPNLRNPLIEALTTNPLNPPDLEGTPESLSDQQD
ncbi:hypothetical protein BY996DRAFT_6518734 [Phakopsora pachyrhizi]|uniref:Uncharacterized protein n=1 Tax=Phakopsora pachyrhizi TaxID=170000 RepID=A0AAV0ASE7_PHAPC|nr:hypothetical protein BY996DRAFT_6518734 [Phakopsora pachyrhizi]CAH7671567.1 hypothetical protein PPACK8108_LOCUS6356 [Phakopsora pachyrhizi]